jgi:hypothetical protein
MDLLGENFCGCAETQIEGVSFPAPPGHDCEYVRARNALIPQAERIAGAKVMVLPASEDDGASTAEWTRAFSIAMDELSEPLLKGAGQRLAASHG